MLFGGTLHRCKHIITLREGVFCLVVHYTVVSTSSRSESVLLVGTAFSNHYTVVQITLMPVRRSSWQASARPPSAAPLPFPPPSCKYLASCVAQQELLELDSALKTLITIATNNQTTSGQLFDTVAPKSRWTGKSTCYHMTQTISGRSRDRCG